ncbi:MAG: hypothetical protein OXF66_04455 [Gammaproteobacteria bacterium]|nr:hypothetical protein [Gammaproteobacteria bacterium]MCY4166000.1 hypothetical protein [Gammaproteobacteria bacterium]MCY4256376.1 hypothetical protein [Gammaproteobacteria bacterium]
MDLALLVPLQYRVVPQKGVVGAVFGLTSYSFRREPARCVDAVAVGWREAAWHIISGINRR